jgi:hypothetical protein
MRGPKGLFRDLFSFQNSSVEVDLPRGFVIRDKSDLSLDLEFVKTIMADCFLSHHFFEANAGTA